MNNYFIKKLSIAMVLCCLASPVYANVDILRVGEGYYVTLCQLANEFDMTINLDPTSDVYRLSGTLGTVVVAPGMSRVLVNRKGVALGGRVGYYRGDVIAPASLLNVMEQFRNVKMQKLRKRRAGKYIWPSCIVLDAGHGGRDPGAIGLNGLREKDVVLDLCKRVNKILSSNGVRVVMTRADDRFIPLSGRSQIANKTSAQMFISIHADAVSKRTVAGVETFKMNYAVSDSTRARKAITNCSLSTRRTDTAQKVPSSAVWKSLLKTYRKESSFLATSILENMLKTKMDKSRGVKPANFHVLRESFLPAVLVETGFLSNPKIEKMMRTEAWKSKMANAIANGIGDYWTQAKARRATLRAQRSKMLRLLLRP